MNDRKTWNAAKAKHHYRVDRWSAGHFDVNHEGNVIVKADNSELDLYELSKSIRKQGVALPALVRFPQILQQSLRTLCVAFEQAIHDYRYDGKYVAAYPIKVNQQASVIQHFQQQAEWSIVFEIGSKAELMACYGITDKALTIICNGYKDQSYIRLALLGGLLGHKVIIVLESLAEYKHVIEQCSQLNVQAHLGMRVRLSSIAKGNWQNTGGEHSKFGLTSNEVINLVKELQANNALEWMKMLHFHMGSQIPCLHDIQSGITEAMHYFVQLSQHGIEFQELNIGGGLAVDYEGSLSGQYFSMDYSLQDYANTIVNVVKTNCDEHSLKAPIIISENGRAMTAYHAVLFTNVIDAEFSHIDSKNECQELLKEQAENVHLKQFIEQIKTIKASLNNVEVSKTILKHYLELEKIIEEIEREFSKGKLPLFDKALSEKLSSYCYRELLNSENILNEEHRLALEDKLVAKYFCNFSLFQSTPDIWGLRQIFPIMPLHKLNEYPAIHSRIYDLTCDSDGRIDCYVQGEGLQSYLSLHEFKEQQDYILGIFLVGAYQEILGDMHNLFGDTNAVNIVMNEDGSHQICDEEPGDTVAEILSYLHIDTDRMQQLWLERISRHNVTGEAKELVLRELESSLHANSYLAE